MTNSTTEEAASEPSPLSELAAIPGDTYAVKAELKALGAVWDKAERTWRIAPEKLAQARAVVEHQELSPQAATGEGGVSLENLSDPFEAEGDGPRYAILSERDGNLYAAKDALKAIGAKWDKSDRAWKVREEKAEYARAIVASVTEGNAESAGDTTEKTKPAPAARKSSRKAASDETPAEPIPPAATVELAQEATVPQTAEAIMATPSREEAAVIEKTAAPNLPLTNGMVMGGLWRRRGADGKVYLTGYLSDTVEIRIVANEQKEGENEPSHLMVLFPLPPVS